MSAIAAPASPYFPSPSDTHLPLNNAKFTCARFLLSIVPTAFPDLPDLSSSLRLADLASKMTKPTIKGRGELSLPCFVFPKTAGAPPAVATKLHAAITETLSANKNADIEKVDLAGAYLNFFFTPTFLASIIPSILSQSFLSPLPPTQSRVMIEYSQPNTHKAFHVGHMRNAALGDCLVRLYEQMGHPVVAANYFGDEGAHVAKCLWWLRKYMAANPQFSLDQVEEKNRGEWLGGFYSAAVEQLDLATFTKYPYPYILPAKVITIDKHSHEKAPVNWKVVRLQISQNESDIVTVVCGGIGYNVGDYVAYLPVGAKVKGKLVEPKDMLGVMSAGIMMSEKELGIEEKIEEIKESVQSSKGGKKEAGTKDSKKDQNKTPQQKEKGNKKDPNVTDSAANKIFIVPNTLPLGVELTESGRLPTAPIPPSTPVIAEYNKRKEEVRAVLLGMEHGDREISLLYQKTRQWSLDEFKRIYAWLDCRFDVDFFESLVSEESRLLAQEYYKKGVFVNSNGAVGADLSAYGLGFCMVLKSDGSGLYATKDLSLAQHKFEQYQIDTSIYIVDAAQTLHFKQVFQTLQLMGYTQAKNCVHIPYGQVVLPTGKMSSRTGTVVLFSQLREMLNKDIYEKFLIRYAEGNNSESNATSDVVSPESYKKVVVEKWSSSEIETAKHLISVATIKYGMLNHDVAKDIVFVMEEWTAKSGNTGPYLVYAYARIKSILREVYKIYPQLHSNTNSNSASISVDYSLLSHETERLVLVLLMDFWPTVESCTIRHNPSQLCDYLFEVSKSFSAWYEKCSILRAESEEIRAVRVKFIEAIAEVIKVGLGLLGIKTLEKM